MKINKQKLILFLVVNFVLLVRAGSDGFSDDELFAMGANQSTAIVESLINQTGLQFKKNYLGFSFVLKTDGGRTQQVIVGKTTSSFLGVDFISITSVAIKQNSRSRPVNGPQMRKILTVDERALGCWCLGEPLPDVKWLYYSSHLPVSASAKEVEAAIRACAHVADKMENELTGTDRE